LFVAVGDFSLTIGMTRGKSRYRREGREKMKMTSGELALEARQRPAVDRD